MLFGARCQRASGLSCLLKLHGRYCFSLRQLGLGFDNKCAGILEQKAHKAFNIGLIHVEAWAWQ